MSRETETEVDKAIGARIRERRVTQGMSQAELGVPLGISFQQVQKYENGKNRVSASSLVLIARALHCTVAYFYKGIDQGDRSEEERPLSPEAIKIARRYDAVRDPELRGIMSKTLSAFEKEASHAG